MLTKDINMLLSPQYSIKKVQLVVYKTDIPAGFGILANGQIIYQTLTDFFPVPNDTILKDIQDYFRIKWTYAYYDQPMCNFAFNGIIQDTVYKLDDGHIIQPGIEVLNSYNQRISPHMYWMFYDRKEDCYIKTNISVDFMGDISVIDNIFQYIKSSVNYNSVNIDILRFLPQKMTDIFLSSLREMIPKYGDNRLSYILALSKILTKWERTSYELSRKKTTFLINQLLKLNNKEAGVLR